MLLNDIQNRRCKTSRNGTLRRSVCRIGTPAVSVPDRLDVKGD